MDPTSTRARRGYELGRARAALRVGWFVAPMIVLAAPVCGSPAATIAIGTALFAAAATLLWRGEEFGDAVFAGMLAGAAPLLFALVVRASGHPCTRDYCWTMNVPICIFGGAVAGVAIALRAARVARRRAAFLAAGWLIAGLTGSMGCVFSGVAGLAGMAAGVLMGSVPLLVYARLK